MARNSKSPEKRRQDLIEAATELFRRKGFDATSVEEIAIHAGVAKGTVYLYFHSKDEILSGIVAHMLHHVFEYIDTMLANPSKTAIDKMHSINGYLRKLSAQNRAVTEEFHEQRNELLHWRLEKEAMKGLIPRYQQLIEQGNEEGTFNAPHPRESAMAMLAVSATAFGQEAGMDSIVKNQAERYRIILGIISKILGASPALFDSWLQPGDEQHG